MAGQLIELNSGALRLVANTDGGGVAQLEAVAPDGSVAQVMIPAEGPLKGGCQLLVPWSNRLSGGGFTYDGRFHPVEPNVKGEAYPLHGDGFQRAWHPASQNESVLELKLENGAIGPYRYAASVSYSIVGRALAAVLRVENRSQLDLPFGLGFHPWFPRSPATTLMATATGVQLQDECHLPTEIVPIGHRPDLDFCRASPLPPAWVNNAFLGWRGRAEIVNGPGRPNVILVGSVPLDTFILYSPSHGANFFCLEPVTHPVDAHHGGGLNRLAPGEAMSVAMVLQVGW